MTDQVQDLLITELRKRGDPISLEAAAEIARLNGALEAIAPSWLEAANATRSAPLGVLPQSDEVVTRFIAWKACSVCGQPIHGEAWAKRNGSSARHKPECPSQVNSTAAQPKEKT